MILKYVLIFAHLVLFVYLQENEQSKNKMSHLMLEFHSSYYAISETKAY